MASDHFVAGQNNVICDICGCQFKSNELKKTWNGLWVCAPHWSPRHPQDFVKGVKDTATPVLSRPEPPDTFTTGATSLADPNYSDSGYFPVGYILDQT